LKEWLYKDSAASVRKILKDHRTSVVALNSLDDFGLVPQENLPILEYEAEMVGRMCEAVECPLVVAPVGRWFDNPLPREEVREKTLERLEVISRILAAHGAAVGLEPIAFSEFSVQTVQEADSICFESDRSDTGLVIDYYNLFQGGMKPDDFSAVRSPIHIIHVNDAEMLPLDKLDVMYTRTFPGDGSIDTAEWTAAALRAGYTGVFSFELFVRELWSLDPDMAMYKTAKKLNMFAEMVEACS
jgi:sugar phosphate isomerase/epimerase